MTRVCILMAALAVIARARVTVLPGWVVPLPVLILAALVVLCATAVAWLVLYHRRTWTSLAPPGGAAKVAS